MHGKTKAPRVDPGVWEHEKVRRVSESLGIHVDQVVRRLAQTWALVMEQAPVDGVLMRPDGNQPAILTELRSRIDYPVVAWLKALKAAGLLDDNDAAVMIHDWADWQDVPRARSLPIRTPAVRNYGISGVSGTTTVGSSTPGTTTRSGSNYPVGSETSTRGPEPEKRGAGEKNQNDQNNDRKTTGEGPTSSAPFTRFMWWLVEGFDYHDYPKPGLDASHMTRFGKDVDMALVAECYIAIAVGKWGDDWDQKQLSGKHALQKIGAFQAFKTRRRINGTVIPLTAAGSERHPSTRRHCDGVAREDAGAPAVGNGASRPAAGRHERIDVRGDPKVAELRARRAQQQGGERP